MLSSWSGIAAPSLRVWARRAVVVAGAVLVLATTGAAQAGNFTVVDKLPATNPTKSLSKDEYEAVKQAVKDVVNSKVVEAIDKQIEKTLKDNGIAGPAKVEVEIEIASDWQAYKKIINDAFPGELDDATAEREFEGNSGIARTVPGKGPRKIKVVLFANRQLQDRITEEQVGRVIVHELGHARARALAAGGLPAKSIPPEYNDKDDPKFSAPRGVKEGPRGYDHNKAFGESIEKLWKLVPVATTAEPPKTAEEPKTGKDEPKKATPPKKDEPKKATEKKDQKTAAPKPPPRKKQAGRPRAPVNAATPAGASFSIGVGFGSGPSRGGHRERHHHHGPAPGLSPVR